MSNYSSNFEPRYLGLIDYDKALAVQHELHELASKEEKQYILGLEHPTVMTLGLRAHNIDINSLCVEPWNYPVFKISRGGLATIHNPGQLVIYPIINLRAHKISVKNFVNSLFLTTQKTLAEIGITTTIDLCGQPGVYTDAGKIAFCGLQIKNDITMHGLSINLYNDISVFGTIQSCGVSKPRIDSVKKYQKDISTEEFFRLWLKHFNLESSPIVCDLI